VASRSRWSNRLWVAKVTAVCKKKKKTLPKCRLLGSDLLLGQFEGLVLYCSMRDYLSPCWPACPNTILQHMISSYQHHQRRESVKSVSESIMKECTSESLARSTALAVLSCCKYHKFDWPTSERFCLAMYKPSIILKLLRTLVILVLVTEGWAGPSRIYMYMYTSWIRRPVLPCGTSKHQLWTEVSKVAITLVRKEGLKIGV